MPELRIDPLTGLRTIVAGERAVRPGGGMRADPRPPVDPATDPFAEGHEDRTPPELFALRPGGGPPDSPGWLVRGVPNLYPALAAPDGAAPPAGGAPPRGGAPPAGGGARRARAVHLAAGRGRARGDRQRAAAGVVAARAR